MIDLTLTSGKVTTLIYMDDVVVTRDDLKEIEWFKKTSCCRI